MAVSRQAGIAKRNAAPLKQAVKMLPGVKLPAKNFGVPRYMGTANQMFAIPLMEKMSNLQSKDTLKDYQQRVVDKLYDADNKHGLIAYHSTGSGKTFTALSAVNKALQDKNDKALWIAPASLTANFGKEKNKHGLEFSGKVDVYSYEKARNLADTLKNEKYKLVVLDEAHKLRNSSAKVVNKLQPVLNNADKVLMLTGTASYNQPVDTLNLIHILDKNVKAPTTVKDFSEEYVEPDTWKLKAGKKKELRELLRKYVDLYETPKDSKDFPEINRKVITTEMSPLQTDAYRYVEKSLPALYRFKIRHNLPMSLKESANLNAFTTGVRQVSTSPTRHQINAKPEDSAKLMEAANHMAEMAGNDKNFRGIAYSNYLEAGLDPYASLLKDKGLDPVVFTGKLNAAKKKELVDFYNKPGGKKVLLLSSSGAEGLDLKNTRLIQILDPHFNRSKIQQVEGRGARYHSHIDLPEKDRNVLIEEYHSTLPKTLLQKIFFRKPDTSIDTYLAGLSNKKENLINEMKGLIKDDDA